MTLYEKGHYEVFVTSMHGNGAGHYAIEHVNIDSHEVEVSLNFIVGDFEVGSSVMNQRVLFFLMNKNCALSKVNING
jgi:hypothetical protein